MQTLFTTVDADQGQGSSSRRGRSSVLAVSCGMWCVVGLLRVDIPFALLGLLLAILYLLLAMEILPERWPWPAEAGLCSAFAVVGMAEFVSGRAVMGWTCSIVAIACVSLVVVRRRRRSQGG